MAFPSSFRAMLRISFCLVLLANAEEPDYTVRVLVTATQALADRVERTIVNNPAAGGPMGNDGKRIVGGWAPVDVDTYVAYLMQEVNYLFRTVTSVKLNVVMTHFVKDIDKQISGGLPSSKNACGNAMKEWKVAQTSRGMTYHDDFDVVVSLVDAKSQECGLGSAGGGWASDGLSLCKDGQFAIVADIGYASAHIIAHELGHNFGLGHVSDAGEVIMNKDAGSHWSQASMDELARNIPQLGIQDGSPCLLNTCVQLGTVEYKRFVRNEICNFRYPFDTNARSCDPQCGDTNLPLPRCGTAASLADCSSMKCNKKNSNPNNMGGGYCQIDASPWPDRVECKPLGADDEDSYICYQGTCTVAKDVHVMTPYSCGPPFVNGAMKKAALWPTWPCSVAFVVLQMWSSQLLALPLVLRH